MKTVIFSDTHLTKKFEEEKFLFLKDLIQSADHVIINGDFWEGRQITFDEFLASPWNQLFPYLKAKNTIYLYGNHDEKYLSDERCNLFSNEQKYEHVLQVKNKILLIEHGHNLNLRYKKITYSKIGRAIAKSIFVSKQLENIERYAIQKRQRPLFVKSGTKLNRKIKLLVQDRLEPDMIYVCGHTHVAETDKQNNFINIGSIRHGKGEYLTVNDAGIQLKKVWYS